MSMPDSPLARLTAQLPLADRRAALPPEAAARHRDILLSYVRTGRPPAPHPADVVLAAADLIVRRDGAVDGAYPFTSEPTVHVVRFGGVETHAMCSVDALALAPLLGTDTEIRSICAVTGAPVRVRQRRDELLDAAPAGVRVGIRWQDPGTCAAHSLCRDMVFLAPDTVPAWGNADVSLLGVAEAAALGAAFFAPLFSL